MKTKLQYIAHARTHGYRGRSFREALDYVRDRLPRISADSRIGMDSTSFAYCNGLVFRRAEYLERERARTSHPEARRARRDREFRRGWLRRIRREREKILAEPATPTELTRREISRAADNARLTEISTALLVAEARLAPTPDRRDSALAARIPRTWTAEEARGFGVVLASRVEWCVSSGFSSRVVAHKYSESAKRNGRWHTVQRAEHSAEIRCFGMIDRSDARRLVLGLPDGTDAERTAPAGCTWSIDSYGIELRRGPDSYHPVLAEFLDWSEADMFVRLDHAEKIRREEAARKAVEAAEAAGICVCAADSVRGGNCRAGTEAFAATHRLEVSRHYRASDLLAAEPHEFRRVQRAIFAAKARQTREEAQGFSVLADHRLP